MVSEVFKVIQFNMKHPVASTNRVTQKITRTIQIKWISKKNTATGHAYIETALYKLDLGNCYVIFPLSKEEGKGKPEKDLGSRANTSFNPQ